MKFLKLLQKNREVVPEVYEEIYGRLVEKKLTKRGYNPSKIQAILNNYLSEPERDDYVAEFNRLQEVRKICKAEARAELGE